MINKWLTTDAKWYQFWMPQSGAIGGFIGALVVPLLILILILRY